MSGTRDLLARHHKHLLDALGYNLRVRRIITWHRGPSAVVDIAGTRAAAQCLQFCQFLCVLAVIAKLGSANLGQAQHHGGLRRAVCLLLGCVLSSSNLPT